MLVSETSIHKEGKLLGLQKLQKASGTVQEDASYDLLEVWNLKQYVKVLIFDTTASNTGKCLLLALIIGAVYVCLFGDSSAPDVANFQMFSSTVAKNGPL